MKSKLTDNALTVLQERYLWRNGKGQLEKPEKLFSRVAKSIGGKDKKLQKRFLASLESLEFMPNSPTLMNAGKKNGQLAACFVLPLEDDLSQIMDTLKLTALIHQSGGGTGFSFSKLRPEGAPVHSSQGVAAGPIGFLTLFNQLTENIKQGGLRRGANMGILSVNHPDIEKFIHSKED
ncbi:MAG: ribonucleotide reductase N-terminal alpha domain-containing protein, partial [Candidatus Paceibacterales bacterium]